MPAASPEAAGFCREGARVAGEGGDAVDVEDGRDGRDGGGQCRVDDG